MRMQIPEIVDIHLPVEGVFHNLMLVSIKKSYPGQARKVMNAIWSLGQAMFTKVIIVVDEDCDVQDIGEVTLRVANNIDRNAIFSSPSARSTRSTTPAACPTTAARWA